MDGPSNAQESDGEDNNAATFISQVVLMDNA